MSEISKFIGQRIRNYRTQQKLSQEKLAELSGCHPTYIGQVERGEKNATLESIEKIASALNIPLSRLFEKLGDNEQAAMRQSRLAMPGRTQLRRRASRLCKPPDRRPQALPPSRRHEGDEGRGLRLLRGFGGRHAPARQERRGVAEAARRGSGRGAADPVLQRLHPRQVPSDRTRRGPGPRTRLRRAGLPPRGHRRLQVPRVRFGRRAQRPRRFLRQGPQELARLAEGP